VPAQRTGALRRTVTKDLIRNTIVADVRELGFGHLHYDSVSDVHVIRPAPFGQSHHGVHICRSSLSGARDGSSHTRQLAPVFRAKTFIP
jgi:hypothetical protein